MNFSRFSGEWGEEEEESKMYLCLKRGDKFGL